jgi:hypothetical protein
MSDELEKCAYVHILLCLDLSLNFVFLIVLWRYTDTLFDLARTTLNPCQLAAILR